jgi:hypothetical protein
MYQVEKYNYNKILKPIHQQQYQAIRIYQTQQPIYNYDLQQYNNINNRNKIIRKQIFFNRPLEIKDKSSSTNSGLTESSTENSNNSSKNTLAEKNDSDKRLKHNRDVLYYLNAGDIIEYSKSNDVWNGNDRLWGIYTGNGYVIHFDKNTCQIVIDQYWNLAKHFYMSCNIDLDRNYFCLPSHSVIDRARYALKNNQAMRIYFSSDKNFVMWYTFYDLVYLTNKLYFLRCRYDINKSDVEFSTNMNKCPQEASKYMMITRFLDCVEKHNNELVDKSVEDVEINEKEV